MPAELDLARLPERPCLLRVAQGGRARIAVFAGGRLLDPGIGLDGLLRMRREEIRSRIESARTELDPRGAELLAPVESQEVWASGVTYLRSREARMEESSQRDAYAQVYEAERPELFFKAAGWRVVAPGAELGLRPDSSWDVPEPELAVLTNAHAELVAYAAGNDMSSRSIEGENPLYLPQAKIYERSCSIGPAAVLAWHAETAGIGIGMSIERLGRTIFEGSASLDDLVRDPAELAGVLHSAYPLPEGAWLLTGTGVVPPPTYTAMPGDLVTVTVAGIGVLVNPLSLVAHSGATALPRLPR